ncbi:hypothetical protein NPIL_151141 [Nephila pilipes]|uniref:Uncharacterized protein n=1 Tax=Nephila pilipes TaxID=299642 RepID=A0A8X6QD25_NEPPI|nr:hypothetical protein NPIL_151141 [Nephila pilipes]
MLVYAAILLKAAKPLRKSKLLHRCRHKAAVPCAVRQRGFTKLKRLHTFAKHAKLQLCRTTLYVCRKPPLCCFHCPYRSSTNKLASALPSCRSRQQSFLGCAALLP